MACGVCRQPGGAAYPVSPMTSIVPTIPGSAGYQPFTGRPNVSGPGGCPPSPTYRVGSRRQAPPVADQLPWQLQTARDQLWEAVPVLTNARGAGCRFGGSGVCLGAASGPQSPSKSDPSDGRFRLPYQWDTSRQEGHQSKPIGFWNGLTKCPLFQSDRPEPGGIWAPIHTQRPRTPCRSSLILTPTRSLRLTRPAI